MLFRLTSLGQTPASTWLQKCNFKIVREAGQVRPRWSYYVEMASPRWLRTYSRPPDSHLQASTRMHACTHAPMNAHIPLKSKLQSFQLFPAIGFSVELLELLKFPFHLANQKEISSSFNKRKKKKKHPNFQRARSTFSITLCFLPSRGKAFNLPRPGTL